LRYGIETFEGLYALARAEDWRDECLKPLTLGWLMGYYDKHYHGKVCHNFARGTLACDHYRNGVLMAALEIEIERDGSRPQSAKSHSRLASMFGPDEIDYYDGSGLYSSGVGK